MAVAPHDDGLAEFLVALEGGAYAAIDRVQKVLGGPQPFGRSDSFRLLNAPARPAALAAVPLLVFAAPFIIMRNTIRGCRIEGRRLEFVMLATVLAGVWSMMSGTAVVMVLRGLGL